MGVFLAVRVVIVFKHCNETSPKVTTYLGFHITYGAWIFMNKRAYFTALMAAANGCFAKSSTLCNPVIYVCLSKWLFDMLSIFPFLLDSTLDCFLVSEFDVFAPFSGSITA